MILLAYEESSLETQSTTEEELKARHAELYHDARKYDDVVGLNNTMGCCKIMSEDTRRIVLCGELSEYCYADEGMSDEDAVARHLADPRANLAHKQDFVVRQFIEGRGHDFRTVLSWVLSWTYDGKSMAALSILL